MQRGSKHVTFGLSGKCRGLSRSATGLAAAVLLMVAPVQIASALEMNGDARELTVVLQDEARPQVVAALAERLGFRVVGTVVEDGTVSGRFRGDLAKVLNSVLTQNGFVIVYEGGKPSRLLLSAKDPNGSSAAAMPAGSRSLLPSGYDPTAGGEPSYINQDPGLVENPAGGEYQPDPTEMPVETPVENVPVEPQQGNIE